MLGDAVKISPPDAHKILVHFVWMKISGCWREKIKTVEHKMQAVS